MNFKGGNEGCTDDEVKSDEYEPEIQDIIDHDMGIKNKETDRVEGWQTNIVGNHFERYAQFAFKIKLERVATLEKVKTPDYINSEKNIIVEVYSRLPIGKIRETAQINGCSLLELDKRDLSIRVKNASKHAKEKITKGDMSYLRSKYGIRQDPSSFSLYVMSSRSYFHLSSWNEVEEILARRKFDDYGLSGFVIYAIPDNIPSNYRGVDTGTIVFYQDINKIDKSIFPDDAKFIEVSCHE